MPRFFRLSLLLLLLPALLPAQRNRTLRIDPAYPTPPLERPGYRLVFHDEFDGPLDTTAWNRSGPGNDAPPYGDTIDLCRFLNNAPYNPSNVLPPHAGALPLRVRRGEDRDSCAFSAGEIKSFDNAAWSNERAHRMWKLYPGTYLEARVRMPDCPAIGAAFWLYSGTVGPFPYTEIDMFELLYGRPSEFQANFHYGPLNSRLRRQSPTRVRVRDLDGQPVRLADHWLTFGVAWDENRVQMYLNGVLYKTVDLSARPVGAPYLRGFTDNPYKKIYPFETRLGTGAALGPPLVETACDTFPQFFQVDYVRAYRRADRPALFWMQGDTVAMRGPWPGANLSIAYYPGVRYTWESQPWFKLDPNPAGLSTCNCAQWWASPREGLPAGDYPLTLTAIFPGGQEERHFVMVSYRN